MTIVLASKKLRSLQASDGEVDGFVAHTQDDPENKAEGRTQVEAIGSLIVSAPHKFGIVIKQFH